MKHNSKRENIQPGDLLAYKAMLLAIASEAVAKSQQPMGESHRNEKQMLVEWLNDLSKESFNLARIVADPKREPSRNAPMIIDPPF